MSAICTSTISTGIFRPSRIWVRYEWLCVDILRSILRTPHTSYINIYYDISLARSPPQSGSVPGSILMHITDRIGISPYRNILSYITWAYCLSYRVHIRWDHIFRIGTYLRILWSRKSHCFFTADMGSAPSGARRVRILVHISDKRRTAALPDRGVICAIFSSIWKGTRRYVPYSRRWSFRAFEKICQYLTVI